MGISSSYVMQLGPRFYSAVFPITVFVCRHLSHRVTGKLPLIGDNGWGFDEQPVIHGL